MSRRACMPTKLDSDGNYQPFPGYTVICKLNLEETADIWRNIFSHLVNNSKVTDFYSILPFSSWHVTAINLFTKEAVKESQLEWGAYVASKQVFFNELIQVLKQNPLTPSMHYSRLHMEGALQIEVVLDNQRANQIEALAKCYKYERSIPRFFHVTLGYQYKILNDAQFKALKLELTPLIQAYFKDLTLKLQPAQLCYFDDMTAFTPLDRPSSYSASMFAQNPNPIQPEKKDESGHTHDSKLSK
jgi:hypothetical protein